MVTATDGNCTEKLDMQYIVGYKIYLYNPFRKRFAHIHLSI